MLLTVTELHTHLYGEIVEEITRDSQNNQDNNIIAKKAIKAGEAEVRSYISGRYDADALFSATGDDRDEYLLHLIKDVATWHLICLANPNVEMSLREKRYDDAIAFLTKVQSGKATPDWPKVTVSSEDAENGQYGIIKTGYISKRNNYY